MNTKTATIYIQDQAGKEPYQEVPVDDMDGDAAEEESNSERIGDEEIDGLIDGEDESSESMVLRFKVNQMQKICNSLTTTNRRLINKVAALEQERQKNKEDEVFVDEYSQLNGEFTEVENLINQYRTSLSDFQTNLCAELKAKEERIAELQSQVSSLTTKNKEMLLQKEQIEKLNRQLQTRNEGLLLEIENIEQDRYQLQQKINSLKHQRSHKNLRFYDNSFVEEDISTEIQVEYEQLIDKLVQELEYERNIKKKMGSEIKRLTGELKDSEKQIMQKNRKLYEIEMKFIKSAKVSAIESNHRLKSRQYQEEKNNDRPLSKPQVPKQDPRASLNFLNFPLLELINGQLLVDVSAANRKIIGLKIIELYERKIGKEDYINVMPQNLLITNYSSQRPQLLMIRKTGNSGIEQGQKSQESLIWNLAFILDNLFGQVEQAGEFDEILEWTGQMLEKQMPNSQESLETLKQLLRN